MIVLIAFHWLQHVTANYSWLMLVILPSNIPINHRLTSHTVDIPYG